MESSIFKKYFLPGFVFQSVVIAGGYGTGRELVEFFLTHGPLGGLLAMLLISTVIWSAVCAASFEFARLFASYDYRSFFTHLLGKGWVLYELCYFALLLIVLAVIASAAGSILEETFELPYAVGVIGMMLAVGTLVFRGSDVIENVMAGWSFVLYGVYIVFVVLCFRSFGQQIVASFVRGEIVGAWPLGGVRYAAYNVAIIPAILFSVRHVKSRRQAVTAGILAGPIAIIPGLLFFIAMAGQYPQILDRAVPANYLLEILGSRTFQLTFQIVLFGTLIETGSGMIHAVNERIAGAYAEKLRPMPRFMRFTIAVALLFAGSALASFGLIGLIARGYGTLTWLFLFIFVVPILTRGVWMTRAEQARRRERAAAISSIVS